MAWEWSCAAVCRRAAVQDVVAHSRGDPLESGKALLCARCPRSRVGGEPAETRFLFPMAEWLDGAWAQDSRHRIGAARKMDTGTEMGGCLRAWSQQSMVTHE